AAAGRPFRNDTIEDTADGVVGATGALPAWPTPAAEVVGPASTLRAASGVLPTLPWVDARPGSTARRRASASLFVLVADCRCASEERAAPVARCAGGAAPATAPVGDGDAPTSDAREGVDGVLAAPDAASVEDAAALARVPSETDRCGFADVV